MSIFPGPRSIRRGIIEAGQDTGLPEFRAIPRHRRLRSGGSARDAGQRGDVTTGRPETESAPEFGGAVPSRSRHENGQAAPGITRGGLDNNPKGSSERVGSKTTGRRRTRQAGSPPNSMNSRSIFGSGRSWIAASKACRRL